MYSSAYVWAKVLAHMEERLTATVVSAWLDDAEVVELNEKQLVLYTPQELRKNIIETRYAPHIQDGIRELFQMDVQIQVLTGDELDLYHSKNKVPEFLEYNPQFTFDRFIVGPSNRFAHAAAIAVANKPAEAYNPLFIYGPSGLGKTHLLYAIAGEINKHHPHFNIVYIKGDEFTNELIKALQEGRNQEFRNKYRNADLFLVDDIQFVAGKDATQEEFFHTFNTLYENHKQIVLTSDRPPSELLRLEDRLKTRFEWGLIADIQPPDYETRVAIIKNKAIRMGVELPEEVLTYVAENITANVRQIEGTVNKILAYRDLMGSNVDANAVTRAVRDMFKDTTETSLARQIAMYLIRNMTKLSLKEIGKEFNNRDHTTVLHAIERIEEFCKTKPEIAEVVKDIRTNVNNRYG